MQTYSVTALSAHLGLGGVLSDRWGRIVGWPPRSGRVPGSCPGTAVLVPGAASFPRAPGCFEAASASDPPRTPSTCVASRRPPADTAAGSRVLLLPARGARIPRAEPRGLR